jgi:hypothetical protein
MGVVGGVGELGATSGSADDSDSDGSGVLVPLVSLVT